MRQVFKNEKLPGISRVPVFRDQQRCKANLGFIFTGLGLGNSCVAIMIPAKMHATKKSMPFFQSYFENRILAGEMQHSRNASYAEILVKIDGGEQTALARHRGLKASPLLLFIKKGSQLAETRITDIKNLKSSYK